MDQVDEAIAVAEWPDAKVVEPTCRPCCSVDTTHERRGAACVLLAATALWAALAAPFFAGRVYVADDLGQFHLPVRAFYAEQLARGEAFDWMPSLYGGFYVAGEGQLGAYHPWHLALYRWLPLQAAFGVELLASYPLMFAGTYLLLRRLVARRDAALLGALVFAFGSFSLLHFVHPNAIAIVAHLPWLLVAIEVALASDNRWQRGAAEAAVALLIASQLLLGYPQYVWFSLVAAAAFVLWRVVERRAPVGRLAMLGVMLVAGITAGSVQLLPTWHLLGESTRQSVDARFANSGSLHPLNLVQLAAPYLFSTRVVGQNTHELGLYVGAVPLVLCVWLLAQRRTWGRYRPLVRALLIFGGFALLLAAGEFGGLYRLQAWLPVVNRFRFPCRAIVLMQLCLATGAAVAAAMLLEPITAGSRAQSRRVLLAVFAASVVLAALGPLVWPEHVAAPWLVWSGPLLIGAAAMVVVLVERGVRGASLALILLTALDLGAYGLSYAVPGRTARLDAFVAGLDVPPDDGNRRVVAPRVPGALRTGDSMLLTGLARIDGYAGLEPKKRLDPRSPRTWQLAGAGWAWIATAEQPEAPRRWLRVGPTAPRARLVSRTLANDALDDDFLNPAKLTLESVVADPTLRLPASAPGTASVAWDKPGSITIETDCPARQLLVLTESFDRGWRTSIDGSDAGIVRVDGDFLGCAVPAGKHRVRFEFRPVARAAGLAASIFGLGLMGLALVVGCLLRRPKRDDEKALCRDHRSTSF